MRRIVVALLPLALVFAACGNDDGSNARSSASGSASGSAPAAAAPVELSGEVNNMGTGTVEADKVEVELDDYYFKPTFIKGQPGEKVTVDLKNEGNTDHTFTSDTLGVDEELQAGKTSTVTVTLPQQGAVEFVCRFHKSRGMKGAFYQKDGDTVTSQG
jgi:plastocyanin